jgi:hypothetical protein
MQVTQKITPALIRVVVTSTHNDLYTARITEAQLIEIISRYELVFKRPRGKTNLREIDTEENQNASTKASSPQDASQDDAETG